MRLFVAINFPEEVKKTLLATMHELKTKGVTGSYSPGRNLHMTLVFIGEVPSADPVKAAMKAVPFTPFHLTLTDLGNFGDILWVGAKGGQKLKEYDKNLRAELDRAGIRYDRKKSEPHITLVRRASNVKPQGIRLPRQEMMVEKISLMRSDQKNGQVVYTEIFSVGGKRG